MLTLSDINTLTSSHDGDIYSDLYKDVHGFRPRYARFDSIEDFDRSFESLSKELDEEIKRNNIRQARNFDDFVCRVDGIMQMVQGCDRVRAIEIIADAEGEAEAFQWYGYERLEYDFDLKYGSIKQWLEAA